MTQEPGDPTNGEGAAEQHVEQATGRDLQRHALQSLVVLSEQCAVDEDEIERRHDGGAAAEAKAFEHANWNAEQRAKGLEENVRAKYEERLGKITAQFEADTASIREADEKAKRKVQVEFTPLEQGIKKKYDEAVWLADAELEARQNQIRVEQKKANEDLKAHGEEIDDLEGRAIALLKTYRHKPADQDMSLMATAEGEKKEPGNYPAKRDAAVHELDHLRNLFAPRLLVGARPFLILIVLLALGAGGTYFKTMDQPLDPKNYIVVCGGVLVAAIAIGTAIMVLGKSAVRKGWTRTKKYLDESRKAAKIDHENTLKELEDRTDAAKQKRATEAARSKRNTPRASPPSRTRKRPPSPPRSTRPPAA